MSESIRDRIGSVTRRLANRVGRAFGTCRSCGRPTRSHHVGSGVQCHRCYVADEPVPVTDGGTSDRHSREEQKIYALLSGENPEDATLDPREDRQVVPAGYAADGVCGGRCPTDADDAPDAFIDAAVAAVREWQSRNEPLGKRAVDDLRSKFAREPGEPAVRDNSHGARCVHLREVEATELGVWVADADVALVDLDDDVRFADLHAVPIDDEEEDKYVPLVVAADGFFGEVAASFHEHYHALQRVRARLDAAGPILTDGGDMSEDDSESTAIELSRAQWRTLLDRVPEQTYGDLISAVESADTIDPADPANVVDTAIANGPLVEDDAGMFPQIRLDSEPPKSANTGEINREDADSEGTNPKGETGDSPANEAGSSTLTPTPADVHSWSEVDFSIIDPRTWAPAQIEHESWMCRTDSKAPYAPWTDSNAPVECGRDHEDREGTVRCSTCDHAAGYKWGSDGSRKYVHADHDTAREWADMTPSLSSDLAFIQRDDDPFAFVDGDDVRDPDTGEIHPAFRAILEHLGLTYADVSTSGSGVHAVYRGEIPLDGVPQAMFAIDDEPFGANEDVPEVEIYDSKHVCIATGDHLSASGTEVNFWDEDTLTTILQANGIESSPEPSADTSIDLTEHTPTATTSDETTDEIRDIFAALDRINAQRVAHDTIVATWNDDAGTSAGNRAFAPTWGPSANGTANIVNEEIWQDTGGNGYGGVDVMAAIDCPDLPSYDESTQPRDLNGADWFRALEHLRDLGYPIPELEPDATDGDGDRDPDEHRSDPTDLTATVSVKRAWDAAGRVSPSDVDSDSEFTVNDDAGSFACPCCGEPVDVVRAVAIDTGLVDSCEESLDETYPTAYDRARSLGAPLPEYYTTTDAIARFDALLDVIGEVTFWDLDIDALDSEVTGTDDDVSGDAVRTLNPSWRESESEASVLVFPSGTIWDADTERVLDAVRFVAVDSGLIEDPTAPVEGATFTEAYRRCRNHYAAPLPHWNPAGGDRTVTPDLPDGRDLVDTRDIDGVNIDRLEDARERVESVFQDAATIDRDDSDPDPTPSVLTSLPATGKTTAAVKSAREHPSAYTTPRKELQQQAVDKADRWGVDSYILPVFSEKSVRSEILEEAVAHVRECGKNRLRDRWALVNAAVGAVEGEGEDNIDASDIFEEEDDDSVDLDRATCPVADGDYGVAWALAVHVASRLRLHPGEIHMRAQGLFGTSLPCCEDGSCEYGNAWEDVRDPDNCPDLLVGSYTQAHVESARTYYDRDSSGGVNRSPRVVVLDEFPGEAFTNDLGPEAFDFATWLARSLRDDINDRRDMFDANLYSDDWVRAWLEGTVGEDRDSDSDDPTLAEVERVIRSLSRVGELLDARESAAEILSEYRGAVEELGVAGILTEFVEGTTPEDEVYCALEDLTGESIDPDLQGIYDWIVRDVHEPLARATDSGTEPADAGIQTVADTDLPIGGDLASLLEGAIDAAHTGGDAARERIRAAIESLRGGPDGCRQLAAWADDGYAHPDAHHILTGIITPTRDDSDVADTDATRINTSSWAFDPSADEGSIMDVVSTAGNATTIVDRNDHGARLHTPPSRVAGNGEKAPLVGLDATGRAILWRVVLGEEVQTTDIFDSERDRRQFLEDTLDLRVIQAAEKPRFYEGDPATKDTDGDAALLQAIAEEYSGIQAPRQRGGEPQQFGKPAAITTKRIREVLKSDPRLDDVVATWDNYGNVTGKNELGEHRLAAILGCQHFGDDAIEQFAALAGEEVDTDHLTGRGPDLDYDSDVANAYLKHMTEDKTMQAILRFARGEDGGATVVARTSALRDDLPVVGRGDVVETWSDTATNIVKKARSLGGEFTSADVRPAVDVKSRQVRRVLGELVDAGYLQRTEGGPGVAHEYDQVGDPGAGEVSIPDREEAVPDTDTDPPGHSSSNTYYTRNVRVFAGDRPLEDDSTPAPAPTARAPPAPGTIEVSGPPD